MNVKRPTLLVDAKKVVQNIGRMQQKADVSGAMFRPHFKTHQLSVLCRRSMALSVFRKRNWKHFVPEI